MSVLGQLSGKTRDEQAVIKADEHVRLAPIRTHTLGRYTLELRSREKRLDRSGLAGISVYVRAWRDGVPVGFGPDGSVEIERFGFFSPPILVPDPLGAIDKSFTTPDGRRFTLRYREDPAQALIDAVLHAVQLTGKPGAPVTPGKTGRTVDTWYPNAGTGTAPIDENIVRQGVDESFSSVRSGAGNNNFGFGVDSVALRASTTTDQFQFLHRWGVGFPTSGIGSDTINSAIVSLYGNVNFTEMGSWELCCVSFSPAAEDDYVDGDYAVSNFGTATEFITRLASGAFSTTAYNDMTLNGSGVSHINTSGNTLFGFILGWDCDNSFSGSWSSNDRSGPYVHAADEAGTSQDPKITVDHTAAAGGLSIPIAAYHYNHHLGSMQ